MKIRGRSIFSRTLKATFLLPPLAICAVLWARSRNYCDYVAFFTPSGNIQGIASYHGRVLLVLSDINFGEEQGPGIMAGGDVAWRFSEVYERLYTDAPHRREWNRFGYAQSKRGDLVRSSSHLLVMCPHWAVLLLAGIFPARAAIGAIRRWKRGGHHCQKCGYDLSATPGRCPECGTVPGERKRNPTLSKHTRRPPMRIRSGLSYGITGMIVGAMLMWTVNKPPGRTVRPLSAAEQALDKRMPPLDLQGDPLDKTLEHLSQLAGIKIEADWKELESDGHSRSSHLMYIGGGNTLGQILCSQLQSEDVAIISVGQCYADGDVIRLTTARHMADRHALRVYDVSHLVQEKVSPEAPPPPSQGLFSPPSGSDRDDSLGAQFAHLIRNMIDSEIRNGWRSSNEADVRFFDGRLFVYDQLRGHRVVEDALTLLNYVEPQPLPFADGSALVLTWDGKTNTWVMRGEPLQTLTRPPGRIDWQGVTFEQAIERLRKSASVDIRVEETAMPRERYGADRLIDLRIENATAADVWLALRENVSEYEGRDLRIETRANRLVVCQAVDPRSAEVRVYDLRDWHEDAGDGTSQRESRQALVERIKAVVLAIDPSSWAYSGQGEGMAVALDGRLMVWQTSANHLRIAQTLAALRTDAASVKAGKP